MATQSVPSFDHMPRNVQIHNVCFVVANYDELSSMNLAICVVTTVLLHRLLEREQWTLMLKPTAEIRIVGALANKNI